MVIDTVIVGPMMVNCYVLGCAQTRQAVIIDPGDDEQQILSLVGERDWQVRYVLLTHAHVDHMAAAAEVREGTGAMIAAHRAESDLMRLGPAQAELFNLRVPAPFKVDHWLEDGDVLNIGKLTLQVLATPGHSPGGISFLLDDHVFAGDVLFCESIGRSDLPGGSHSQLLHSICTRLLVLPDKTVVHPGHGPDTSIGHERQHNPYLRQR